MEFQKSDKQIERFLIKTKQIHGRLIFSSLVTIFIQGLYCFIIKIKQFKKVTAVSLYKMGIRMTKLRENCYVNTRTNVRIMSLLLLHMHLNKNIQKKIINVFYLEAKK